MWLQLLAARASRAARLLCSRMVRFTPLATILEAGSAIPLAPPATQHGGGAPNPKPRKVETLCGVHVVSACVSDSHALCVSNDGTLYSWGRQGRTGCLGRPDVGLNDPALPSAVALPAAARCADCESGVSGVVLADGRLLMFGSNERGRLGLGRWAARRLRRASRLRRL